MKPVFPLVVIFFGMVSVQAGELNSNRGDISRLQGRWTARAGARRELVVELEVREKSARICVITPQGLDFRANGEISVNEATSPRSLDWVRFTCSDLPDLPTIYGIYTLEGETLTVCTGGLAGPRPREFKPGDGALADVVIFRRQIPATGRTSSTR